MIHIYFGDGKGKTTAALGLVLRYVGHGGKALVVQFLKTGESGECATRNSIKNIEIMPAEQNCKFVFNMTEREKGINKRANKEALNYALFKSTQGIGLVVLDEVFDCVETGQLDIEDLNRFVDSIPPQTELVMTGRMPTAALIDKADYVSEIKKRKHPYDKGVNARKGIEY
ncbi:MAG: cob(I)yrinic acid a,c-diamide adenosyltransferase [Clostridia bacterium]|nr:cob(I)yrinic acid a,c-diamide adenosyltransferase [Clostridia bacterium]